MDYPKVSVIVALCNGEKFLERTILSIVNQTYPNLELVIIDGGSTDGTLEILKKYDEQIDYWKSEPDKGISDAFNKGVQNSTGEFINFQGDGDGFLNENSLLDLFKSVEWKGSSFIAARIARVDLDDNLQFNSKYLGDFKKSSLLFRMSMPHQGLFTHREFFNQYGLFDLDNKFCMDYEHLLRAYKTFPKVVTSNVIVARWRNDGLGNGRIQEVLKEYHKIKIQNKVKPTWILNLINFWIMFKFNIKSMLGKV